jgi:uncharacterized protein YjbI with pentapeptide repeats
MSGESGLSIDQPVSIWKRPVNVNPRDLFKVLGKANLDGANLNGARLDGADLNDISWDDKTRWRAAHNLDKAINVPSEWQ